MDFFRAFDIFIVGVTGAAFAAPAADAFVAATQVMGGDRECEIGRAHV